MRFGVHLCAFFFLFSCGTAFEKETSRLNHEDDSNTRLGGTGSALPWHFHTGKGRMSTGESCTLDPSQKQCFEIIHYFAKSEILDFTEQATQLLSARRNESLAWAGMMAIPAAQLGRMAVATTFNPDPSVSKGVAAFSWVGTALLTAGTYYTGKQVLELQKHISQINDQVAREELFVNRCHHVSAGFERKLSDAGVTLKFPENGGVLTRPEEYFASKKEDVELRQESLDWALQNKRSACDAYQVVYAESCGQLPMAREDTVFNEFCGRQSQKFPLVIRRKIQVFEQEWQETKKVKFKISFEEINLNWKEDSVTKTLLFLDGFEQGLNTILEQKSSMNKLEKRMKNIQEIVFKSTAYPEPVVETKEEGSHRWVVIQIPRFSTKNEETLVFQGKKAAFDLLN